MDLVEAIRKFYYSDVSAILLQIGDHGSVIDTLTGVVRHRFDRPRGAPLMATRMTVDTAAIRRRHPHHFGRPSGSRQFVLAIGIAAVLLLLFGMAQLGFFDGMFLAGLGQAG